MLRVPSPLLTSLLLMVTALVYSSERYAPEAPPQLYNPRCEKTDMDPDADCIFGTAGQDYPTLRSVPESKFTCSDQLPGIYADVDTSCQVYHFCLHDGNKFSFLCPNGTMFNQAYFVCDLWFNVNCERSTQFYQLNENIYKNPVIKTDKITYSN